VQIEAEIEIMCIWFSHLKKKKPKRKAAERKASQEWGPGS